jgi:hypothetical protein
MAFLALVATIFMAVVASLHVDALAVDARSKTKAKSFVRSLHFKQQLRICNAYPYGSALDVFVGKAKLSKEPLAYKSCTTYTPALHVGDRVDFKIEDTSAGTFTISELPTSDAVLLMVIYRHDTASTAVSFESHVFANQAPAQIAVLDTYKGKAKSELRIQAAPQQLQLAAQKKSDAADDSLDDVAKKETPQSELLRYDNVVAVDPGLYEVLMQEDEKVLQKSPLVALQQEAYVVVRCGIESQLGDSYPQELIVFPQSDKNALPHSSGTSRVASIGASLLAAIATALWHA